MEGFLESVSPYFSSLCLFFFHFYFIFILSFLYSFSLLVFFVFTLLRVYIYGVLSPLDRTISRILPSHSLCGHCLGERVSFIGKQRHMY